MEEFWEKHKEKIIIFMGIILIIIHGLFSEFLIDWVTIIIYIIIASPMLFDYLDLLRIFGTEFSFKNYKKTKKELEEEFEENEENLEPDKKTEEKRKESKAFYETFDFSLAERNIDEYPNIALASIRIEVEKRLREAYERIFKKNAKYKTIKQLAKEFEKKGIINSFQLSLLLKIIDVCNFSIHGIEINKEEAKEILNIAESLNKSFSIGYCINFEKNKDYKKQGLSCEYEHCIEFMPLEEKEVKENCPIYGHNCPGGEEKVKECKKKKIKEKFMKDFYKDKK